jgi:hypothetical protein
MIEHYFGWLKSFSGLWKAVFDRALLLRNCAAPFLELR